MKRKNKHLTPAHPAPTLSFSKEREVACDRVSFFLSRQDFRREAPNSFP